MNGPEYRSRMRHKKFWEDLKCINHTERPAITILDGDAVCRECLDLQLKEKRKMITEGLGID